MASQDPHTDTPSRERKLRVVILVISVLVGLTAAWGAIDAVRDEPRVWGLLGFEVVTLATAALGIMLGLGRPREAPSLGAACVGATFFAAATLGRFSAIVTRSNGTVSESQAVRMLFKDPMFEGRVAAAALLLLVAAMLALGADKRAWKRFVTGIGLAIPVLAALVWLLGPGMDWLVAPVESTAGLVRVVVGLVGGLGVIILASASVDRIIRAFQDRLPPLGGSEPRRKAPMPAPNKSA